MQPDSLEGKMYDSLDHASLTDLMHSYEDKVTGVEAQERAMKEMRIHRHDLYEMFKSKDGLGQFGTDEQGKPLHTSFKDAVEDETKRVSHTKHFLYKVALSGMAKDTNRSLDEMTERWNELYSSNDEFTQHRKHKELKNYIEKHGITDEMRQQGIDTFDKLASHFATVDIYDEIEGGKGTAGILRDFVQNYASNLHPIKSHGEEIAPRIVKKALSDAHSYHQFRGMMNARLEPYNLQLKNLPTADAISKAIQLTFPRLTSSNPGELLSDKRHMGQDHVEYIQEIPEPAKIRYFPKSKEGRIAPPEVIPVPANDNTEFVRRTA